MRFSCGKLPGYDKKSCRHDDEPGQFRVMVGGYYIPVCENAFNWAKRRSFKVSKGRMGAENVPFHQKIPAIRLNHSI